MLLTPGSLLNDRYRIEEPLGQGGMGVVYRARETTSGSLVAVKINRSLAFESPDQFLREARRLAGLQHANLPRVIDFFLVDGQPCLVMEFIPGEDLDTRLKSGGPQPVEDVLRWAHQLGSALEYLHGQKPPVIHRDIKPGNLKLTPGGQLLLVDFGIARLAGVAELIGANGYTPGFAPPEQVNGMGTRPVSDQYAFAATLYTLLTGQPPPDSIQRILINAELVPMRQFRPGLPGALELALSRALALLPEDRFQSIPDFLQALEGPSCERVVPL